MEGSAICHDANVKKWRPMGAGGIVEWDETGGLGGEARLVEDGDALETMKMLCNSLACCK